MEYNYYATPPPIQNPQQVQMMPAGVNNMMHVPSPIPQPPTPQNHIRQVVTPGASQGQPMNQSMQHQQHLGLMHHQMPPSGPQQPPPHNYHQQLPLQHQANAGPLPPAPHSASPASHIHSPHQHNLQQPPRPPTGPSPHPHMHQQSPHLLGGPPPPPMHMQPQQLNQITGNGAPPPLMIPTGVNGQPQQPLQQTSMHHPQGFMPGSSPMPAMHYSQPPPPGPSHQHPGPPLVGPPPPHNQGPPPPHMNPIHHHHNLHPPHLPPPPGYMQHPGNPTPQNHPERGSPFYQNIPQTEFRIIELNKRLQTRPNFRYSTNQMLLTECSEEYYWWEKFASDFFDDDSTLTLAYHSSLSPDDKVVEYRIGRTLIPRFFRSYFAGGVIDLSIKLRNTRELTHNSSMITLECDQADITTKNIFHYPAANMPMCVIVHTEGRLSLDFVSNSYDTLLIKSWRFYTNQYREYIDRSAAGLSNAFLVEPVTRYGLTKSTLSFLKMCMIMEPMQELMFHHKHTKIDPRSCLKQLLVDKYKHKTIDDTRTQTTKRRKRRTTPAVGVTKKGKANNVNNSNANIMNNNNNNIGFNNSINNSLMTPSAGVGMPNLSLASQDVMVVGEPSMLGQDFGDENERRITRLVNNQFDPESNNVNNQNQLCNNTNNNNQQTTTSNSLNHMQLPQQQQQNNLDMGNSNMQMLNHTNSSNNGTSDPNDVKPLVNNNNGQICMQNNDFSMEARRGETATS